MLQTTIGVLFGTGLYMILADYFKIPYISTSKAVSNMVKHRKAKASFIDIWLNDAAIWLSKRLRLNEYRRMQIEMDLHSAGISLSPEMHIAKSLVKTLLVALITIPIFFIFPILTPLVIALSIFTYLKASKGVSERIREKRRNIEYELPRFVSFIEKTLKHSRNVLHILEQYKENAGEDLKRELQITVADMRSGNYEAALTRLESRVGSTMLSDVTRGLIGVMRGDETDVFWSSLTIKFSDYQRQLLKQQAQKVPKKVRRLSMSLLFCFIMMYVVVIGTVIVDSLGILFG